jgi:kinesin family protein C2/C3
VDLLRRDDDPIRALHLEFNADGSAFIRNIRHHEAKNFLDAKGDEQLIKVLNRGLDNRLMRSTEANECSSRSHLLFAVNMFFTDPITGDSVHGKIMFVDLAGSERLAKLGFTLYLYEEAVFINESLAILGKTIWRLSKDYEPRDIDYNCNILTSLLKDTLGGAAKTLMFVCIGPSIMDAEATRDTLRFAISTGKIKAREDKLDVIKQLKEP